jgi:hypothetical protein
MSTYLPCGCRDCFDVAIGENGARALCLLCKDAGCVILPYDADRRDEWSGAYSCQRSDDPGGLAERRLRYSMD